MAFFDKVGVSVIFLGPRATTRVAPTVCARGEKSISPAIYVHFRLFCIGGRLVGGG